MSGNRRPHARDWVRSFGSFIADTLKDAAATVRGWSVARWLIVIAGLLAIVAFITLVPVPDLATLRAQATQHGHWSIPMLWIAYVVFTLFPIPRTLWTVASGVLFGPIVGLLLALSALTVSASIAFSAVRSILGDWMRPRLTHPAVAGINNHLAQRGWVAIASLRMIAAVPFSVLNYTAALTSIPLGQFAAASLLGSIPTTAMGVFFGDALVGGANPWVVVAIIFFGAIGVAALYMDYVRANKDGHQAA